MHLVALAGATILILASSLARAQGTAPPQVPVTVGRASVQDVPIYERGEGTVQAYQSVLVRAQVTGYLQKVAFTEGQQVKPGDELALIDPRPFQAALAQAEAKKASDAAQLANANLDLARYSTLARSDFASRQQLDTQRATVQQAEAAVQGDDAAIQTAALNLAFCHITSPIAGVVGLRMVDVGNLITADSQTGIVSISQVQPISVVFTLAEEALPRVQAAMGHGDLAVLAYGTDDRSQLAQGVLLTPNNSIDTTTGTISLKATFQNADRKLWPGQFINARVQVGMARQAVVVPNNAIQHGPNGLYVYTVKSDQTVADTPVTVTYQTDSIAVVEQGLQAGEAIVLDGQSRLQDGSRIAAKDAEARG